jgi:predicted phage tail protein
MTHVKLLGELGDKFGTDWQCAGKSVREVLKLIDCQVEGFKEYIAECHDKNIGFTIQNGNDFIENDFNELGLNNLKDTVIISAVPAGSGKGLGKLITGLLMLTALFFMPGAGAALTTGGATTSGGLYATGAAATGGVMQAGVVYGTGTSVAAAISAGASLSTAGLLITSIGANLAIMGITQMSAPDAGDITSDPSYLFNGADNNIEQGQPVPVLYGTMKIGGTSISQGFQTGQLRGAALNYRTGSVSSSYYGGTSGTSAGGYSGKRGTGALMRK